MGMASPRPRSQGERQASERENRGPQHLDPPKGAHPVFPEDVAQLAGVHLHLSSEVPPHPGCQHPEVGREGLNILPKDRRVQTFHKALPHRETRRQKGQKDTVQLALVGRATLREGRWQDVTQSPLPDIAPKNWVSRAALRQLLRGIFSDSRQSLSVLEPLTRLRPVRVVTGPLLWPWNSPLAGGFPYPFES